MTDLGHLFNQCKNYEELEILKKSSIANMQLKLNDLAWFAGLCEGDGTFVCVDRSANSYEPCLGIRGYIDLDTLLKCQDLFGGHLSDEQDREHLNFDCIDPQPYYNYAIQGINAILIMEQILPFMGQRRSEKIQEILSNFYGLKISNTRNFKIWERIIKENECYTWTGKVVGKRPILWHTKQINVRKIMLGSLDNRKILVKCDNDLCVNPKHLEVI